MRITVIIILSLFVLAACNDDTGTLIGRLTDDYGDPVKGAEVYLNGTDYRATTDDEGRYAITGIEPGVYDVTGSAEEYDFDLLYGVGIEEGEAVELDLNAYCKDYSEPVARYFKAIASLPPGSTILVSMDLGPSTLPELEPILTATVRHVLDLGHRIIAMTLRPAGPSIAERIMLEVTEELNLEYEATGDERRVVMGEDWVYLGFQAGYGLVILQIGEEIRNVYPADYYGTPLDEIPMMATVHNYDDMAAVIDVSGTALPEAWVAYAGDPYGIPILFGVTAVMAPQYYAYLQTGQIEGLVGGLKGAAEYEKMISRPSDPYPDEYATLSGVVTDEAGNPVSEATIRIEETDICTGTDEEGRFSMANIPPGRYDVACSAPGYNDCKVRDTLLNVGIRLTLNFTLTKPVLEEPLDIIVRKPNIYLYPEETSKVAVTLSFPLGGGVTVSDPPYGDGWEVEVTPEGEIDGICDYLFYEAETPDTWQRKRGWIVTRDVMADFFADNLREYGFRGREVDDFLEYWMPRLTGSLYYAVYPQTSAEIDAVVELQIVPEPTSVLRLFYLIEVMDETTATADWHLPEPEIPAFEREGFTVVEWGVCLDGVIQ